MDHLAVLHQLADDNGGLIRRADVVAAGVPPRAIVRLLRRGVLARVARGVYAVSSAAGLEPWTAAMSMHGRLSFESAAAWWGVDLPTALDITHVTAPRNRGRRRDAVPGVRLHRADLGPADWRILGGVAVTAPLRTVLDIARHNSLEDAVAIIDAFLRRGLVTGAEVDRALRCAAGPGRLRMQLVAKLIDPQSGSILESLTRVLLWRRHLTPPKSQHAVHDPTTGWRGRVDFAWPELRVALECDGYEWHRGRGPFQSDRRRWSSLSRLGWRLAVVTWFDVVNDPDYVVGLVTDLLVQHTNVA